MSSTTLLLIWGVVLLAAIVVDLGVLGGMRAYLRRRRRPASDQVWVLGGFSPLLTWIKTRFPGPWAAVLKLRPSAPAVIDRARPGPAAVPDLQTTGAPTQVVESSAEPDWPHVQVVVHVPKGVQARVQVEAWSNERTP